MCGIPERLWFNQHKTFGRLNCFTLCTFSWTQLKIAHHSFKDLPLLFPTGFPATVIRPTGPLAPMTGGEWWWKRAARRWRRPPPRSPPRPPQVFLTLAQVCGHNRGKHMRITRHEGRQMSSLLTLIRAAILWGHCRAAFRLHRLHYKRRGGAGTDRFL